MLWNLIVKRDFDVSIKIFFQLSVHTLLDFEDLLVKTVFVSERERERGSNVVHLKHFVV